MATIFWRDAGIHSARDSHTMHYGDSLAIECTSVVHLFLLCIVGFNECTRENPLRFRTPLTMAVRIGSYFGYSLGKIYHTHQSEPSMIKGPKSAHSGLKQCIHRDVKEEVEDTREEEEKVV